MHFVGFHVKPEILPHNYPGPQIQVMESTMCLSVFQEKDKEDGGGNWRRDDGRGGSGRKDRDERGGERDEE